MEEAKIYLVEITPQAEKYYIDILEYLFATHSQDRATLKSEAILEMAMSQENMPHRGSLESSLDYMGKAHKYLVYHVTKRKTIKIIYFIEEPNKVFVTDFFPCNSNSDNITQRNK